MPSLFVIQGRNRGTRYDLTSHEGAMSIGREAGNFVQLDDNEVSRRHAEVRRVGDSFVVGDLKSSNGTWLNSRKIERAELASGDQIQVGRTILVYSRDGEDVPAVSQVDIVSTANAGEGSRIVRTARDAEGGDHAKTGQQNKSRCNTMTQPEATQVGGDFLR